MPSAMPSDEIGLDFMMIHSRTCLDSKYPPWSTTGKSVPNLTAPFCDKSAHCSGDAEFFMDLENVATTWGEKRLNCMFCDMIIWNTGPYVSSFNYPSPTHYIETIVHLKLFVQGEMCLVKFSYLSLFQFLMSNMISVFL